MRETRISVRLTAEEARRLQDLATARATTSTAIIRQLLADPGAIRPPAPTLDDALAMLAESARDGSVAARVALARLLVKQETERSPVERRLDELDALAVKRRARV